MAERKEEMMTLLLQLYAIGAFLGLIAGISLIEDIDTKTKLPKARVHR